MRLHSRLTNFTRFLLLFWAVFLFASTILYAPQSPLSKIKIAQAAVAHDATSESDTGTSGNASSASFTWTHTPVGTPRGVLVFVYTNSDIKTVTSVTYGGTAMTEITGGAAVDTAGEPGRVDTFFLGSSVPTGAQSVVVNRTNNTVVMYATAATVTAAANTEIYSPGIVLLQENGTYTEQSVTDGSTGVNSLRYAACYYGGAAPAPQGASSTLLQSIDLGAFGNSMVRETTAGQGARNVGCAQATADDRAGVHLAVREVPPGITVSGTLYDTTETATINTNGTTVKMSVNGTSVYSTTTAGSNGSWIFSGVTPPTAGDVITIWMDTAGANPLASLVFKYGTNCTGTPNCTGLSLFQNRVIIDTKNSVAISNADLASCDNDSGTSCTDTDIGFTSNTGTLTTTWATNILRIKDSTATYTPGGNIVAQAFQQSNGTFNGETFSLDINDGDFTLSGGTFNGGSGGTTVERNFTFSAGVFANSGNTLTFDGSDGTDDTTVACAGGAPNGTFVFSKSGTGGTATDINSNCSLSLGASPTTTLSQNATGSSFTNNGTLTVASGTWTINIATAVHVAISITNNGTITHNGNGWDINHAIGLVNSTGATITYSGTAMSIEGIFTQSGTFSLAGKTITFDGDNGTSDSTISCTGTLGGTIVINKTTAVAAETVIGAGCSVSLGASPASNIGNANGDLTVNGTLVVESGTWTVTSAATVNTVEVIVNSGGTITHNGNGWDINNSISLINNTGGTITYSGTALSIEGNFTHNGTFDLTGKTVTFDGLEGDDDTTLTCGVAFGGSIVINKTHAGADSTLASSCTVSGNFTRTDGDIINPVSAYSLIIQGNFSSSTTDEFGGANLTVEFGGANAQTITQNAIPTINTSLFKINKTNISDNVTLATDLVLGSTLTITKGTLSHGATFNISGLTGLTIDTNGTFLNTGTGDLTLAGAATNNGTIYFRASDGCGSIDTISITSSVAGTQRAWSGSGQYILHDVSVQDQGGLGITAYSSTNVSGNGWSFTASCFTLEQTAYRFFNNADSTDVGAALANQNTSATLGTAGASFRLRTLIHVATSQVEAKHHIFKLQFAIKSGTCDTSFTGETYADVTTATAIAYKDNTTPADGANLTGNANDPTHGADTIVNQTYEEVNNFINSTAAIPAGQDGKWDFALYDNGAPAGTSYCFRVVLMNGTTLNTYTVIPEIKTMSPGITISGTVYSDEGSTTLVGTQTVRIKVNGVGEYIGTLSSGTYSIGSVTISTAGDVITVYLDGATEKAVLVTRAADTVTNITGLNLYQNRVIVRHEDAGPITNTNLDQYDSGGDPDINFTVTTGALTVADGHKLMVWTGKTFTPGGTVTTDPSALSSSTDGDLAIQASAVLNMETNALSIGGDFVNAGTFSESGSPQVTTFTATATGHTIDNGTGNLDNVTFNGSGGGWSFSDASNTIAGDITMTAGTLSGTSSITVNGGDVTGDGTITLTGGTFLVDGAGNFGGATAWTFNNLTFGDGTGAATTTAIGTGSVTASSTLTIAANQTLDAGSKTWVLSGTGTPLVISGTFTPNTSTIQHTGATANVLATTYKNLTLGGTGTYTMPASSVTLRGNLSIASGATVTKGSGTVVFAIGGGNTQTWTDNNATAQDLGTVQVSANTGNSILNLGSSVKASKITIDASQTLSLNGANTLTLTSAGAGVSRPLINNGTFTGSSGTVVYSGDGDTDLENVGYYNVTLSPTIVTNGKSYTFGSGTLNISNNLDIVPSASTAINLSVILGGNTNVTGSVSIQRTASATSSLSTNLNYSLSTASLNVATGGTFTANGSTVTLTGSGTPFTITGTFNAGTSTIVYSSTTATNITPTTYNNLSLTPAGTVTYTLGTGASQTITVGGNLIIGNGTNAVTASTTTNSPNVTVTGDLSVAASAVLSGSGSGTITVNGGDVTGDGNINLTGGTVLVDAAGSFGGATGWTFNNLTLGDGIGITTTTATGTGSITVAGALTVAANQTLDAASKTWILSGTGTPLVATGTFTANNSTFQYTGSTANVTAATFKNLTLGGTGTYTLPNTTLTLRGNLVVTSGATVTKGSGTMLFASGAETQTVTDNNATKQDLGAVQISANTTNTTLTPGSSIKVTSMTINGSQTLILGSNTLTLTGNSAPLSISGTLTEGTSTIEFAPAATTGVTVPARTYYNVTMNRASNSFTVAAGTFTVSNTLNVTAGTLDLDTNDPTVSVKDVTFAGTISASATGSFTVTGNWDNDGTFTHNSGTVTFNPSSSSVLIAGSGTGNNTFHNMTISGSKTIQFEAGDTITINNTLNWQGSDGNPLTITSDTGSTQWTINFQGSSPTVTHVIIKYGACHAASLTILSSDEMRAKVYDGGNNGTCWNFLLRGSSVGGTGGGSGGSGATGGGGSSGGDGGTGGGSGGSGATGGGGSGGGSGGSP